MTCWLDRSGLGLLSAPLLLLLALFVGPLAVLLPTSFHPYYPGRGIGETWTLETDTDILGDPFYLMIIGRTLELGLIVVLATLIIGYPLAYFLARTRSRLRPWLIILVVFPLLLNLVVRSFGWIVLLSNNGLINEALMATELVEQPVKLLFNFTGLLIGLSHIFLPFMVLVLIGTIQNIPRDVEEAAFTLGASRWTVLRKVTLPLSLPGIFSGSILVFVLTISALVTPRLLGGPTYQVMSTLIYDEFLKNLNWPRGAAMAFILTAIVLFLVWLSGHVLRWCNVEMTAAAAPLAHRLRQKVRGAGLPVYAALVLLFLQVPVVVVVLASITTTSYLTVPPEGATLRWYWEVLGDEAYLDAAFFSLVLAVSATVLSLALGTAAAYALVRRQVPGAEAISSALMAPLVFPAVVVAVALLQYYTLIGLRGSFLSLALAHTLITLPYVVRSVLASIAGADPAVEEAARTLGANGWTAFRLVTLPLIRPGLVAGAIFSFIVSFDNVPVSIFLVSVRQTTLPVKIFTAVEHGIDPGIAAISTLLIIATGFFLVVAERWVGFHRFA